MMVDAVTRTLFRVHPAAQTARMGHRRANRRERAVRSALARRPDRRERRLRRARRRRRLCYAGHGTWPIAAPFAASMGVVAGGRPVGEPAAARGRPSVDTRIRPALRLRADRAADMALLRDLRRRGRQHASARQFSGRPEARCGPPHFARQISGSIFCRSSRRAISAGSARSTRVDALEATFATLGKIERFRGHFYNWYDTQDLRALEPKYISSVDSGNLAGHLIALGNACREIVDAPVCRSANWVAGLEDAWLSFAEARAPTRGRALAQDRWMRSRRA